MENSKIVFNHSDDRYQGELGSNYQKSKHEISQKAFRYVAEMRAKKLEKWIDRCDSVLEFGVGNGWNLECLKCREKSGYDVYPKPERFNSSINFYNQISRLHHNYDKIICHHVLEHTENPANMLNDIKNRVNESGKIIIFVPFEENRKYKKFITSDNDHHLFSWNVQTLGNLLCSQNLNILEYGIKYTGFDRFAAKAAIKLGLNFSSYILFLKAIRFIYQKKEIYFIVKK
ncbi:MAG: hypothetical protein A2277_14975 [Desulfobacterales bacterium RIFOXYA12_FULL_46_15]|nr:MAG: hypothetical protein A2277_14975 [Desulfobacterales bacterium RIFOXYA12_FULL_46_15]